MFNKGNSEFSTTPEPVNFERMGEVKFKDTGILFYYKLKST